MAFVRLALSTAFLIALAGPVHAAPRELTLTGEVHAESSVDKQRWLRATFALDPAKTTAIRTAIEPCLPASKQ